VTSPAAPRPEHGCALCGTPLALDATRCPSCGYVPAAVARARVLARASLWVLTGILVGVYVVALAIVAAAR
jgi:predicted nucleic acid-binding Zn ribbon protein